MVPPAEGRSGRQRHNASPNGGSPWFPCRDPRSRSGLVGATGQRARPADCRPDATGPQPSLLGAAGLGAAGLGPPRQGAHHRGTPVAHVPTWPADLAAATHGLFAEGARVASDGGHLRAIAVAGARCAHPPYPGPQLGAGNEKRPRRLTGAFPKECPAASYSPTPSPVQYHRR